MESALPPLPQLHRPQRPQLLLLDRQALGQRAVQRLMNVMRSRELSFEQVLLAPRLELRGTCVVTASDPARPALGKKGGNGDRRRRGGNGRSSVLTA